VPLAKSLLSHPSKLFLAKNAPHAAVFCTFLHSAKTYPPSFQAIPRSCCKTPGVAHPPATSLRRARNTAAEQQVVTPFRATLASPLQPIENPATLSRVVATLTRSITANPCVCHSYKKTPGWHTPRTTRLVPRQESLSDCGGRSPLFLQAAGTPRAKRALRNHPTHRGTCITNHHGTRITEHGPRDMASGHQSPSASPSCRPIAIDLSLLGVILM
jgi:hypothetical protein